MKSVTRFSMFVRDFRGAITGVVVWCAIFYMIGRATITTECAVAQARRDNVEDTKVKITTGPWTTTWVDSSGNPIPR